MLPSFWAQKCPLGDPKTHRTQVPPWLSLEAHCSQEGFLLLLQLIHIEATFVYPDTITTPTPAAQHKEEKITLYLQGTASLWAPSHLLVDWGAKSMGALQLWLAIKRDAQQLGYTLGNFHSWQMLDAHWPLLVLSTLQGSWWRQPGAFTTDRSKHNVAGVRVAERCNGSSLWVFCS